MSVWVVVGGQFGSEGKGKISAIITLQEQIDLCIRCGGPNSGHSFQKQNGEMVLLRQLPTGFVRPETRLLIQPGYQWRVVDGLLTNFHLPRSTLLALVGAFGGTDRVLDAYRLAVAERYRFFSYGDAMLIGRGG